MVNELRSRDGDDKNETTLDTIDHRNVVSNMQIID